MLAMARALIQEPKVLLVDEMSMGLAPLVVESLFQTVRSIAAEHGTAIVLVEQHVKLSLEVADEAIVLNHGQVVLRDRADALREDDRVERAYFDDMGPGGPPDDGTAPPPPGGPAGPPGPSPQLDGRHDGHGASPQVGANPNG
jgi:branched-chain amino acid transport system ATP-binding protein